MMPSSHQPVRAVSRGWRVFCGVILVSVLGLTLFLAIHRRPPVTLPLPEVHRTQLEMRAGGWYAPGETRGFTGFLLDTYDDGAMKSRSAVSNGLLHGVSQGWTVTSHGLRTKWHSNGQKLSQVNIVNGKLQGTFRTWHENGERAEEMELKNGQPDGLAKSYFPNGFLKAQVTLRNGKVVEQQFWKDGEYREANQAERAL